MYIFVVVHAHAFLYACVASRNPCMCTCAHAAKHTRVCVRRHACMGTHACTHMWVDDCVCVHPVLLPLTTHYYYYYNNYYYYYY